MTPFARKRLFENVVAMATLAWLVAAILLIGGCASVSEEERNPYGLGTIPEPRMPAVPVNGAIYNPGTELTLFEDIKAHRVGDILTVMLVEQNSGTKSSDTNLAQVTAMGIDPPVVGATTRGNFGLNLASNNTFNGESGSSQSNTLNGSVTVTVLEVMQGGNLRVRGEKWIEINQGKEYIRLEGVIRPRDVRPNNTINSTQVADARISYSGTGATENANVVGWVARLLFSPLRLF